MSLIGFAKLSLCPWSASRNCRNTCSWAVWILPIGQTHHHLHDGWSYSTRGTGRPHNRRQPVSVLHGL